MRIFRRPSVAGAGVLSPPCRGKRASAERVVSHVAPDPLHAPGVREWADAVMGSPRFTGRPMLCDFGIYGPHRCGGSLTDMGGRPPSYRSPRRGHQAGDAIDVHRDGPFAVISPGTINRFRPIAKKRSLRPHSRAAGRSSRRRKAGCFPRDSWAWACDPRARRTSRRSIRALPSRHGTICRGTTRRVEAIAEEPTLRDHFRRGRAGVDEFLTRYRRGGNPIVKRLRSLRPRSISPRSPHRVE